jgi:glyoxylase-like metal-dependent hydrolase (beta-lactamase superfamily II)/8-oxo-dGTP pyrophosphatase MutT (NUDIX family)
MSFDFSQAGTGPTDRPPRRAASLVLLRDDEAGMQVLLLRRSEREGDLNGGAVVFPGGVLDPNDGPDQALCDGLSDAQASARLSLPSGALAYWVAAVRECFEEVRLLPAVDADGRDIGLDTRDGAELEDWRHALHEGRLGLAELLGRLDARIAADRLVYLSHWITPPGLPKRFDTRFLVARCPAGQTAVVDRTEAAEALWLTPAQAVSAELALRLLPVTRRILAALALFDTVAAVLAFAASQAAVPTMMPRMARGAKGVRPFLPDEWAYAEIAKLDPTGRGDVLAELATGVAARLSPRVVRVTAGNGSLMTGPGTNSYFVHDADGGCVLIDPGPDDPAHLQALLAAAPAPVTRILVTHTHKDHSPGAAAVHAATGAPRAGRIARHGDGQDREFVAEKTLDHGERIAVGSSTTLRVIHTPGHASNHLCYLLEEERLLFTGDHLMQGSTVVINPPDGDMAAYLRSLQSLLALDLEWLAPGHGFLIAEPHDAVRRLIAHRLARKARVLAALRGAPATSLVALLPRVYDDINPRLHPVALRSLLAHLIELRDEGSAEAIGEQWQARP